MSPLLLPTPLTVPCQATHTHSTHTHMLSKQAQARADMALEYHSSAEQVTPMAACHSPTQCCDAAVCPLVCSSPLLRGCGACAHPLHGAPLQPSPAQRQAGVGLSEMVIRCSMDCCGAAAATANASHASQPPATRGPFSRRQVPEAAAMPRESSLLLPTPLTVPCQATHTHSTHTHMLSKQAQARADMALEYHSSAEQVTLMAACHSPTQC